MLRLSIVAVIACSPPTRPSPSPPPVAPAPQPLPAVVAVAKLPPIKRVEIAARRQAVQALEDKCISHDVQACVDLAEALDRGHFIDRDFVRADALREAACNDKHAHACYVVAQAQREPAKALELYGKACKLGDAHACLEVGKRSGKWEDTRHGQDLQRAACERGEVVECTNEVAGKSTWSRAVVVLEKRCTEVGGVACWDLANAIENGKGGLEPDPAHVRELKLRACDSGDGLACSSLSEDEDYAAMADRLSLQACDLGQDDACRKRGETTAVAGDIPGALALY